MSLFPGPANPVVYAQFNLQGRWRRMLIIAGGYAFLMGGAIWLTTLSSEHFRARDLEGWVGAMTVFQILNLLIFGSFRVESGVRGDVTSRMIESHRLMPTSPLASILGYIFGAPLQVFLLGAVNFVLGGLCCVISGMPLEMWAVLNVMLLFFALCVYAVIVQFSFVARGGFVILLIAGVMVISFAASGAIQLLPSLNILFFPVVSESSVFGLMFNSSRMNFSGDIGAVYLVAVLGQAAIAAIAVRVAIRRYLSSSIVGVSHVLGLLLLLIWVLLAIAQFVSPSSVNYRRFSYSPRRDELTAQMVCAIASSLLLAMFPIASAARSSWRGQIPAQHKPIRTELWTVAAAIAIVSLLLVDAPLRGSTPHAMMTILVVVNFLIGVSYFFCWGHGARRRPWIYVSAWVIVTWAAPVIADGVYRAMANIETSATSLTAFSPPGALALIWSNSSEVPIFPGLIGQVILTVVPAGLFTLTRRSRLTSAVQAL